MAAEGPLLDALATVELSKTKVPGLVEARARERTRDGLVVAVLGDLDDAHAAALSRMRTGNAVAIALVIDVSQWPGVRSNPVDRARVQRTTAHLLAAGWRVITCAPGDDLATLWRSVARGRSSTVAPSLSGSVSS